MNWKKGLATLLFTGIILCLGTLLFFPKEISITKQAQIGANHNGIHRSITNKNNMALWWPASTERKQQRKKGKNSFSYNNLEYVINGGMINGISVDIHRDDLITHSSLKIVPEDVTSSIVIWNFSLSSTLNPINRIKTYLLAKDIGKDISVIIERLKKFGERKENLYGIQIDQTLVKDTFLVTTKATISEYPATETVYNLIKNLQRHIEQQGAWPTNYPMVHYSYTDSSKQEVLVAIPVNKKLESSKEIFLREMMPGNILVANVRGGAYATRHALESMEMYIQDHQKSSPAIPYEVLITNRLQELDSANWFSKVCYPVY